MHLSTLLLLLKYVAKLDLKFLEFSVANISRFMMHNKPFIRKYLLGKALSWLTFLYHISIFVL